MCSFKFHIFLLDSKVIRKKNKNVSRLTDCHVINICKEPVKLSLPKRFGGERMCTYRNCSGMISHK